MKKISWISVLVVGIAFLLTALVKFTLDPLERTDCVLESNIESKITGEEILVVYMSGAGAFKTGGYHMTTWKENPWLEKGKVEGYSVSGNLPPFHKFVIAIQNGVAKYAVDTSGI